MQFADHVRNAVCDDSRLPAARTCQNQHRPFGGCHGFTLLGVQAREKIHLRLFSHWSPAKRHARYSKKTMAWKKLAHLNELPPGSLIEVVEGEDLYAVCNVEGEIRAISGVCPHQGGPLGQGLLDGSLITCPWHAWQFDTSTGQCDFTAGGAIPTYPVRVEAGDILVNLPDRA